MEGSPRVIVILLERHHLTGCSAEGPLACFDHATNGIFPKWTSKSGGPFMGVQRQTRNPVDFQSALRVWSKGNPLLYKGH